MPTNRTVIVVAALAALTLSSCSFRESGPFTTGSYVERQPDSGPYGGEIEGHISLDDAHLPASARLHLPLRTALQAAAADAEASGVDIYLTSGWRSAAYQQRLFDEAVVRYGSADEARRWVQLPDRSKHVTGWAVDIGPTDADDWLIQHGGEYGLCQAYANEMWHFEMADTTGGGCPVPTSDASSDRAEGSR